MKTNRKDNIVLKYTKTAIGFVALLLTMATTLSAKAQGGSALGYSRDFLRDEQRVFSAQLDRAQSEFKAAQDRLAFGLPSLAERDLILGFLNLDAANSKMEGHEERIAALRPAPLVYLRDKQIRLLAATCADLRAKSQRIEDALYESATTQPAGVTNGWKAIPLYLANRGNFARRFRDQSLSPDDLIADVELLQNYPLPLVLGGLLNSKNYSAWTRLSDGAWRSPNGVDFLADGSLKPARTVQFAPIQKPSNDSTATALKQVELKTSELEQSVNHLRTEQSNLFNGLSSRMDKTSKTPTNEASITPIQRADLASSSTTQRTTDSSSITSRPAEQVPQAGASITTTLTAGVSIAPPSVLAAPNEAHQISPKQSLPDSAVKTNEATLTAASSIGKNTGNPESKSEPVNMGRAAGTPVASVTLPPIVAKPSQQSRVWLISGIIGVLTLVIAVALGLAYANRRQAEFEMFFNCGIAGQEESITITLDPNEQCVVLSGERPILETRGAEGDQPCIVVRSFGGPQLRPGASTGLQINSEAVSKPKRLCVGDVVRVNTNDQSHTFTFQGGNFVSAEQQPTSFESATTTIN